MLIAVLLGAIIAAVIMAFVFPMSFERKIPKAGWIAFCIVIAVAVSCGIILSIIYKMPYKYAKLGEGQLTELSCQLTSKGEKITPVYTLSYKVEDKEFSAEAEERLVSVYPLMEGETPYVVEYLKQRKIADDFLSEVLLLGMDKEEMVYEIYLPESDVEKSGLFEKSFKLKSGDEISTNKDKVEIFK